MKEELIEFLKGAPDDLFEIYESLIAGLVEAMSETKKQLEKYKQALQMFLQKKGFSCPLEEIKINLKEKYIIFEIPKLGKDTKDEKDYFLSDLEGNILNGSINISRDGNLMPTFIRAIHPLNDQKFVIEQKENIGSTLVIGSLQKKDNDAIPQIQEEKRFLKANKSENLFEKLTIPNESILLVNGVAGKQLYDYQNNQSFSFPLDTFEQKENDYFMKIALSENMNLNVKISFTGEMMVCINHEIVPLIGNTLLEKINYAAEEAIRRNQEKFSPKKM